MHFVKIERNLKRWTERHIEQSELSCRSLYKRALQPPKSVESVVFDKIIYDVMQLAIENLPETQRRRFVLFHEFGLTCPQIAEIEECTKQGVRQSIILAENKIKEKIKKYL